MGLASKCMIIDVRISKWNGYKTDPKASRKLTDDANAEAGSAIVSKRVIPKEAFTEITTAYNALKAHRDKHTLPWSDKGPRIMTRNIYELFMSGYGELKREFDAAVDEFITVKYPPLRDKAAFRLGDLFNERDYPPPEELREKFRVDLDVDGITEPEDFRVALPEKELVQVKAAMEESLVRRLTAAMTDVWLQIARLLTHYIEKMSDPEEIFRDSTVNNLVELMNILPGLNIASNPKLREIRQRIMTTIGSYAPDDLRKNANLRATAAKEAKIILEEIEKYAAL